jgi:hypothetical protein
MELTKYPKIIAGKVQKNDVECTKLVYLFQFVIGGFVKSNKVKLFSHA